MPSAASIYIRSLGLSSEQNRCGGLRHRGGALTWVKASASSTGRTLPSELKRSAHSHPRRAHPERKPAPCPPSSLPAGSPGIIALRDQEFIHVDFQLWDLLFLAVVEASDPCPIARMTVAAPRTMSPPAKTRGIDVLPFSSATMFPFRVNSSPGVVCCISGLEPLPMATMTVSASRMNSLPLMATG